MNSITVTLLLEIFTKTYMTFISTGIIDSSFHLFTVRPILLYLYLTFIAVIGCVWQLVIKENDDDNDDDDAMAGCRWLEWWHKDAVMEKSGWHHMSSRTVLTRTRGSTLSTSTATERSTFIHVPFHYYRYKELQRPNT